MDSYRHQIQNRQRSKDPLERRMDQWFETGRQFVDGVAGNRPGQRRSGKPLSSSLDNVGRWVGDKIDWFLEDEDDWSEPWHLEQEEKKVNPLSRKKPLEAISLRTTKSLGPSRSRHTIQEQEVPWPEESTFQVNRWERQQNIVVNESNNLLNKDLGAKLPTKRPLPRSSRRRS